MQKWKALQLAEDIWHQEFQNSDVVSIQRNPTPTVHLLALSLAQKSRCRLLLATPINAPSVLTPSLIPAVVYSRMQDKSGFLELSEYVLVLHRASEYAQKTTPAAPGQEVPQNELLQARGFLPPGNTRYEGTYFAQAD